MPFFSPRGKIQIQRRIPQTTLYPETRIDTLANIEISLSEQSLTAAAFPLRRFVHIQDCVHVSVHYKETHLIIVN